MSMEGGVEVVEGVRAGSAGRYPRKSQEASWRCHFSGSQKKTGRMERILRHRENGDAWRLEWYRRGQGEEMHNVHSGSVNGLSAE